MTSPISCYDSSIWCCICRALTCLKKDKVSQVVQDNISVDIGPRHVRTRTWNVRHGTLTYEISQTKIIIR